MTMVALSQTICIAKDEWRYWLRSKLAIAVLAIGGILTLSSVLITAFYMHDLAHKRHQMQHISEQNFVEQPDRHPHRMVHYGHYAFRAPSPLGMLDPGIDAYTGNAIFLEGHRQNSATFAEKHQNTGLTKLGSLSPAFIVQVIAPLILVLIGYSAVSRERESQTLTFLLSQGISIYTLLAGKGLALLSVVGVILLPLLLSAIAAVIQGESIAVSGFFLMSYALYLSAWVMAILLFSTVLSKNTESFTAMVVVWILICVVMPRIASSTASVSVPSAGKLETDFTVLAELRKLGDGHNANDPAFERLKKSLLDKYQVNSVDQLPINFRGVVASASEAELTTVLNRFAQQRMAQELKQAKIARQFGWLSPKIAIQTLSMISAGTSLETHHRFIRETENLRFKFVQSLNQAHIQQLNYQDDINRNKGEEEWQRARVDASNWQMIQGFKFIPDSPSKRIGASSMAFDQLLLWALVLLGLVMMAGRRPV